MGEVLIARRWMKNGKQITVGKAPSYSGEVEYQMRSQISANRIANLYLRLRHPSHAPISGSLPTGEN